MKISIKKTIVMLVCLAILMSITSVSYAMTTEQKGMIAENKYEGKTISTKTITLYRYGPDGSIMPVEVKIDAKNGQYIGEAIANKCEELFKNDRELQNSTNISVLKMGLFCKIKSQGRGFHYQMKLLGKLAIRYILFRLELPRIHTLLDKPLIYCNYEKDTRANTTITSLLFNKTQYIDGKHSVIVRDFVGYTSWFGRFSFSPFDILPRGFFGYAKLAVCITSG